MRKGLVKSKDKVRIVAPHETKEESSKNCAFNTILIQYIVCKIKVQSLK